MKRREFLTMAIGAAIILPLLPKSAPAQKFTEEQYWEMVRDMVELYRDGTADERADFRKSLNSARLSPFGKKWAANITNEFVSVYGE